MDYTLLKNTILSNSECLPYIVTNDMPRDDEYYEKDSRIAEILNRPIGTRLIERYENAIGLMSAIGAETAGIMLEKLDQAKSSISLLKWAMIAINSDRGLNIGDPETQKLLDKLALNGAITDTERDLVKNLAIRSSSISYDLIGREVSVAEVSIALRNY